MKHAKKQKTKPVLPAKIKREYTLGYRGKKESAGLLAPINELEILEPGSSNETLTQRRLREFRDLQQEFYDLRDRYAASYQRLREAVAGGAAISHGQYKINHGVRLTRRPKYKQVVIDLKGEAFQQRVLENTAPHATLRIVIE